MTKQKRILSHCNNCGFEETGPTARQFCVVCSETDFKIKDVSDKPKTNKEITNEQK